MGRFCLRAHAAAGVLVSLSGASAQPCATGSWPALFPAPPLLEVSAVNRVVELDPDDSGPLPRGLLVMGATLYGSAWSRPHPNPLQSVQFWDGWELLPLATDHPVVARQGDAVRAALVFDDDAQGPNPGVLYAVGGLLRPSSAPVARLVNGRWEPVPGVRGNAVDALVFDEDGAGPAVPAMFVVGTAGRTEDVLDAGVLRWDGASWSVPGDSFGPAEITDAVVADPDGPGPLPECLVVCGFIPMTGEAPQWRVAAWDGQTWRALGAPMNASVLALHAFDADGAGPQPSRLFAAGVFSGSGGAGTSRVARFDGNSWVSTGAIFSPGAVKSLGSFDRDADGPLPAELYLGGDHIAGVRRWDGGASWTRIDGPGATSVDQIIGVDPDGDGPRPTSLALVGKIGLFQFEPDAPIGAGAIFWDGASWSDLDRGLDATVNDAIVFDPDLDGPEPSTLIIGGEFRTVGGLRANRVAAWDPARGWRALDQGLAGVVHAFALADLDDAGPNPPRLVAAGNLAFPGAGPGNFVAEWDGQSWSPLGLPFDGPIYSIISGAGENAESVGAELLVGGGFLQVGDTTVGRVARWDGVAWGAVGEGIGLTDSVGFDFDLAVGPAGVLGRSHPRILAASPPGLSFPGAGACAFASFGGDWSPVDPAGQICALTAPDDLGVHIVPAPADEQPADTLYFAREQSLSDFSPPWIGRIRGGVLEPLALPPGSVESALPTISALGFFDEDAEGPARADRGRAGPCAGGRADRVPPGRRRPVVPPGRPRGVVTPLGVRVV